MIWTKRATAFLILHRMHDELQQWLRTPRMLLRRWREDDRAPFARINADARVMEYMPGTLDRAQSDALIERIEAHFEAHGFGLFAAEAGGQCIGFIGLSRPAFDAPFQPAVEIGWRLSPDFWGQGLATEGARAAARHAAELGLAELVSFTATGNLGSRRVMEKLGMTHNPAEDFDHPGLASGHPLRGHVLYRLKLAAP